MDIWIKVEDRLPDFNGQVTVRYYDENDEIKEQVAWYETGNRIFPRGFSLMPPHKLRRIVSWKQNTINVYG